MWVWTSGRFSKWNVHAHQHKDRKEKNCDRPCLPTHSEQSVLHILKAQCALKAKEIASVINLCIRCIFWIIKYRFVCISMSMLRLYCWCNIAVDRGEKISIIQKYSPHTFQHLFLDHFLISSLLVSSCSLLQFSFLSSSLVISFRRTLFIMHFKNGEERRVRVSSVEICLLELDLLCSIPLLAHIPICYSHFWCVGKRTFVHFHFHSLSPSPS